MVGFRKKLREAQNPEWRDYYIDYKMMKRKLKAYIDSYHAVPAGVAEKKPREKEEEQEAMRQEFAQLLDWQIEKTVLFVLEQQGELAEQLLALAAERERIRQGNLDSQRGICIDAYRRVGSQLLELLQFVDMNAICIRKILKKFDKRAAARALTDYYVSTRSNHPYSQLRHVSRHVGIGAMVGAITRSIAELENHMTSLYDDPKQFAAVQDPIVESIREAEERLRRSTGFLGFVGKQMLGAGSDGGGRAGGEADGGDGVHVASLLLNLGSAFLYMMNTYVVVPTADAYARSLGAQATLCGLVLAAMAVSQLASSLFFSACSNSSFSLPLLLGALLLLLGNLLYALAFDLRSLPLLLLGRFLCGLGSARAVNRRYISDCVPSKFRLKASASFVSASALGMAAGPALAGVLEIDTVFLGFTFNANTLPGWVMAMAWLVYMVWALLGFKEPIRQLNVSTAQAATGCRMNGHVEPPQSPFLATVDPSIEPLLDPIHKQDGEQHDHENVRADHEKDDDDDEDEESPATSLSEAYRLLTKPVKVQLFIYFVLKYAMEIVLSESSVITSYYFGWSTRAVAVFLGLLGLTILPINFLVGSYISNIFEDRQILFASQIVMCLGLTISFVGPLPYTVAQYVIGSLITFVGAEILEGVNLSLLSRVMSARLAKGTYNNGLLSTEAGTLARVVADCSITLAGYLGTSILLNATIAPTLLLGLVSLVLTSNSYNSLF